MDEKKRAKNSISEERFSSASLFFLPSSSASRRRASPRIKVDLSNHSVTPEKLIVIRASNLPWDFFFELGNVGFFDMDFDLITRCSGWSDAWNSSRLSCGVLDVVWNENVIGFWLHYFGNVANLCLLKISLIFSVSCFCSSLPDCIFDFNFYL